MLKNIAISVIVGASLLGFVYYMTQGIKKPATKDSLPYFRIDTVIGTDTVWHKVGDFNFINQKGEHITQKNLDNYVYICDFFFVECPGICKDMAVQMRRVYKAYKDVPDVKILSHTVNPEGDSIPALMEYARIQGVDDHSKWIMVTGNKKELYDMARIGYYATATQGDGGPNDFVHTERFILVDKNKNIRGFYDGTNENEVNKMMFDIDKLRKER